MAAIETTWPAKFKIFTVWLFIEKVCQPLYYIINSERRDLQTMYNKTLRPGVGCTKARCLMGNQNKTGFRRLETMVGVENYFTGKDPVHEMETAKFY